MRNWLDPVQRTLDRLSRPVDFFFRDDDIGWGDERLWKLLDLFATHAVPADLAVIPAELTDGLAQELHARADTDSLGFHQHGFAHVNHEPIGRKYEFGPSRSRGLQQRDITDGRLRLHDLLGRSVDPIFTPPWNRCTRTTARCLTDLGFAVLSREARAVPVAIPGLVELPIRIDWFAHRKHLRLSPAELGALIATAIGEDGPVGVMFHHAVMDGDERAAAGQLLTLIAQHPMVSSILMRTAASVSRTDAEGEESPRVTP